jgi:N-acetylglucosamine-6-phosphate deacetylase
MGLKHVTHCFNAMRAFNHREPGVVGAALDTQTLSCEIILDKVHVHPVAVRMLLAAKSRDKVVLVTDSISGTGMPEGVFNLQGKRVKYTSVDARLADGTLAGSVLTMDRALKNLGEVSGSTIEEVWMCSSHNAAKVIGLDSKKGKLRNGMDADLVVLNTDLDVMLTMVRGKIVFERGD